MIDVEGALLETDLLWEGLAHLAFARPSGLVRALGGGSWRRAALDSRIRRLADLDLERLPLNAGVEELIRRARRADRRVLLLSRVLGERAETLVRRVGADGLVEVEDDSAADAESFLARIRARTGSFDFVGGDGWGIPLCSAARRVHLVEPDESLRASAREAGADASVVSNGRRPIASPLLRALRPHQWVKNGLLLLPILAAHLRWDLALLADVVTGLASFSLLASAVYIANDLADLRYDRRHPSKRHRPLAAGDLSIPAGAAAMVVLAATSALLALRLPDAFAAALAAYLVVNVGYSWGLKRLLVLDVILLAALYTVRVVAGAALAQIELTSWFLAFSVFLFLSLALLKRVVELRAGGTEASAGRSYRTSDLPVLQAAGPSAGVMSALVYCLYITGPVRGLYDDPELLWLGLPVLLYWIVRVWILALRGEVDEDPVVFVAGDPGSYLSMAAFLLVVFAAS